MCEEHTVVVQCGAEEAWNDVHPIPDLCPDAQPGLVHGSDSLFPVVWGAALDRQRKIMVPRNCPVKVLGISPQTSPACCVTHLSQNRRYFHCLLPEVMYIGTASKRSEVQVVSCAVVTRHERIGYEGRSDQTGIQTASFQSQNSTMLEKGQPERLPYVLVAYKRQELSRGARAGVRMHPLKSTLPWNLTCLETTYLCSRSESLLGSTGSSLGG